MGLYITSRFGWSSWPEGPRSVSEGEGSRRDAESAVEKKRSVPWRLGERESGFERVGVAGGLWERTLAEAQRAQKRRRRSVPWWLGERENPGSTWLGHLLRRSKWSFSLPPAGRSNSIGMRSASIRRSAI